MPTIIDLNAEAEKLTTLHGMTRQATPARRKGGMARLGAYTFSTARGPWRLCATTDRPSLSSFAPE